MANEDYERWLLDKQKEERRLADIQNRDKPAKVTPVRMPAGCWIVIILLIFALYQILRAIL